MFSRPRGEGGGGVLDSHEEREGLLENMAGGYFLGIAESTDREPAERDLREDSVWRPLL